jgi:hypothetical protein
MSPILRVPMLLAAGIALLSACSTTTVVYRGEPFDRKGSARLVTREGAMRTITHAQVVGDSLIGTTRGADIRIPIVQADRLEYVSHGMGVLQGLLFGPLVGMGVGVVLGASSAGECDASGGACIFGGPGGMGFMGFLGGMIWGPIIGGATGAKVMVKFDSAAYVPPDLDALKRVGDYSDTGI